MTQVCTTNWISDLANFGKKKTRKNKKRRGEKITIVILIWGPFFFIPIRKLRNMLENILLILHTTVPVPLNRKQSYDCAIVSFVIRLRMQIMSRFNCLFNGTRNQNDICHMYTKWDNYVRFPDDRIRLRMTLLLMLVRYIEDICFFISVNTKYISSSELKTSKFDGFNSRDEIYLVFTEKKSKFSSYFIHYTGIFQFQGRR